MITEELYKAIDQIFRTYRNVARRSSKVKMIPTLDYYASPNPSISGISPTILNLKADLDLLYKPRRSF